MAAIFETGHDVITLSRVVRFGRN